MNFKWYIEWTDGIQTHTLIYIRYSKDGQLVSINVIEYAAELIDYAASYHYFLNHPDPADPYHVLLLYVDNTAAESWVKVACKSSLPGRALSRL